MIRSLSSALTLVGVTAATCELSRAELAGNARSCPQGRLPLNGPNALGGDTDFFALRLNPSWGGIVAEINFQKL